MFKWALVFLVIALLGVLFELTAVAGTAYLAAKVLFLVFLILFVLSLLLGYRTPRTLS